MPTLERRDGAELASAEMTERVRGPRAAMARIARSPVVAPILALLPSLWLALPLLWTTPLSSDHATHLFKAWHFWEEMLGRGRLRGWSHFWAFGSPTGELVPFGGELWVALFRAATLGQLSWMRTYSIAFAGVLIFKAIATYLLARTFFGRRAAVVCATIAGFDPGGGLEGGWEWHTYWGVWPVTLAMSAFSLGLVQLERVLSLGRSRNALWAGLWLAAALLTHPIVLLAIVIVTPALLLDHLLRPRRLELGRALGALGALALAFALSAFFLVPFFARSQHTQDLGWLGESLPVVSQKLVELRTFQNVWVPVHGLALLGGWLAWRRRVPGAVFFVTAGAVLVFLASGVLLRDFHLERVLPSLIKIEANRFLLVAKLFWFPLAGYGAIRLAAPLLESERLTAGTRALRVALGAALALALLAPGYRAFYKQQLARGYIGESKRKYWVDFPAMLQRTTELRRGSSEHFRIAYHMWRGDHLSTLAPVFNGALMYKVGYTPAQIYDKLPMTEEHELLQKLSVKYIVSEEALDRPDVTELERFGGLILYSFDDFRPEPFTLIGAGRAELLELSPERVRVRLEGTEAGSRLVLHVASYDRWRATLGGGDELPIATVPALGVEYPMLMEVPAGDGELELRYVYRAVDWAGLLVTLAALPAFAAVTWLGRRRSGLAERAAERLRRHARALGWGALAGALVVAGLVAFRARSRERLLPPRSIFHRVEARGGMMLGDAPCVLDAPLSFTCGAHRVRADVSEGVWGLHLCLTAPDAGDLRVRVQTQLGSFLAGHYDTREEGPGSIRVSVDGEELGNIATRPAFLRHQRFQLDTRARRHQTASLEVVLTGMARNCFDLQTAD
jgi:hypothetical protein